MCCNHELEELMLRSFNELKNSRPNWSSANIDQISTQVQRNAEHQFGIQFEVVVGVGDYASKSNFYRLVSFKCARLICKMLIEFKIGILVGKIKKMIKKRCVKSSLLM
jgi:hypothetical protein